MTVNTQQAASIIRQVLAVAAIVMGALTQALSGIHLSPAISAVMAAIGGVILAVEHYVGDPSTGTTTVPVATQSGQVVNPSTVTNMPVVPVVQTTPVVPPPTPPVVVNPPPPPPSNA